MSKTFQVIENQNKRLNTGNRVTLQNRAKSKNAEKSKSPNNNIRLMLKN